MRVFIHSLHRLINAVCRLVFVFAIVFCFCVLAQDGKTALMRSAEAGRVDCARLLLDAGVDKNAKAHVRAINVHHSG